MAFVDCSQVCPLITHSVPTLMMMMMMMMNVLTMMMVEMMMRIVMMVYCLSLFCTEHYNRIFNIH